MREGHFAIREVSMLPRLRRRRATMTGAGCWKRPSFQLLIVVEHQINSVLIEDAGFALLSVTLLRPSAIVRMPYVQFRNVRREVILKLAKLRDNWFPTPFGHGEADRTSFDRWLITPTADNRVIHA